MIPTEAVDPLAASGWLTVEGFFTPDECRAIVAVCDGRRWPDVPADLVPWIMDPRWAALAGPFLGPDVCFFREQVVTKAPHSAAVVPWHQDSAYAAITGEFLTCFVALENITVDNGCLWLLAGSHKNGVAHHLPRGYLLEIAEPVVSNGDPVPMTQGDLLAFSSLAYHRSGPNRTDSTRRAWMVQFRSGRCPSSHTDGRLSQFALGLSAAAAPCLTL